MPINESDRRHAYHRLESTIGPEATNTLFAMLPTHPTTDLVTRDDMQATTVMLRGEMAELRTELRLTMQRWMGGAIAANTAAATRLELFPADVSAEDLDRCFSLTPADLDLAWTRSDAAGRVAAGLKIGAVRLIGFVPDDLGAAHVGMVEF